MDNHGEIIIYQTEDGLTRINVNMQNETVWLSLDQMAELFQRDKSTISRHIKNIYTEGESFPDAIDMMIRGVKAGLDIGRIIKLVSMESKDPIASEYLTISQKLDLGVEPEKVLVDAADKIDIEEFRFLVVVLKFPAHL